MSEAAVLVTGATGFLGRHVLESLDSWGLAAIALVRDLRAWQAMDWTAPLQRVTAVADEAELPDQLGALVHLAALVRHSRKDASEVYEVNVEGTLHMVRLAAAKQCRMVYASTSGVVGCFREPGLLADEDAPYALSEISAWPYYHSKAVAEQKARALSDELGVQLVILRPPVLLGPGDHRFRSTGNLIRFLRGRLPFLVNGGMHFADVRDVAEAVMRAIILPKPRPVYHLTGTVSSIPEFFALAASVSGVKAPQRTLPPRVARFVARVLRPLHVLPDPVVVEMAAHHWGTSSRYAEAELGYGSRDPRITMRDTIDWLRQNHPELTASSP